MPVTLDTNIRDFVKALDGFSDYADRLLRDTVEDGLDYGQRRMKEIVPRDKGTLADAVQSDFDSRPGHHEGSVYVNPFIAPHAGHVDKGTGVDGPFNTPVVVHRPSRKNPNKPGVMQFFKNGEPPGPIYRQVVKINPSSKIERGKNFSGRTYNSMVHWTEVRVAQVTSRLATHLASKNH